MLRYLQQLADILEVSAAFLLAETAPIADVILALAKMSEEERVAFAKKMACAVEDL